MSELHPAVQAEEHIRSAAAGVSRRYREHTTYNDLVQEGFEWALRHPGTIEARLADGKRGSYRLVAQIAGHLQKVARAEKAVHSGYSPDDEYYYSKSVIETALPAVWDEQYMLRRPDSGDDPSVMGRGKADPATGNDWLATVLDIRAAWERVELSPEQREAMVLRYRHRMTQDQIADAQSCAQSTVSDRISGGLKALVEVLGGPRPQSCGYGCECNEKVGSRRVLSNAQARAITSAGWEE